MSPVSPENTTFQHALAEARAQLRKQIIQDIAALRDAVNEATDLVQEVRRERAAVLRPRMIETTDAPTMIDQHSDHK